MNPDFPFDPDTLTLATVVMDETADCHDLPEGVTRVQTVYLFAARVAMHICSFQAGTDAFFLETVVTENGQTFDLTEKAEAFREDCESADRDHQHGYRHFNYIDVDKIDPRRIAKVGTFTPADMLEAMQESEFPEGWEDVASVDGLTQDHLQALQESFIDMMVRTHTSDAHPTPDACDPTVAAILDKLAASRHLTGFAETEAFLNRVA